MSVCRNRHARQRNDIQQGGFTTGILAVGCAGAGDDAGAAALLVPQPMAAGAPLQGARAAPPPALLTSSVLVGPK